MDIQFVLCDDPMSFYTALHVLQSSSAIVLDCEGLNLGTLNGQLSLLSLRPLFPSPSTPSQNYIFDFLSLPSTLLPPLFTLLSSPSILKIVFDGRMDFSALYHGYRVELVNVLDLQLVDVASRFMRGESADCRGKHRKRLGGCFGYGVVGRERAVFEKVHVLNGLGQCLVEHGCVRGRAEGKKQVDHDIWTTRPLPLQHLQYAAHDVELIHILHSHFSNENYIVPHLSVLLYQSKLYVSLWSDAPPVPGDDYRSHPLLPLEIISAQSPTIDGLLKSTTPSVMCKGCLRSLTLGSFPVVNTRDGVVSEFCIVCYVLPIYLEMKRMRRERIERDKEERERKRSERQELELVTRTSRDESVGRARASSM
ncbi:ribonuclease H-like domain-containing protein [Lentinula raphanica]|nr:ribonuclease H-like domain-containing protein [Lentinula raphanica]